jgi:hypothetical protein
MQVPRFVHVANAKALPLKRQELAAHSLENYSGKLFKISMGLAYHA